MNNKVIILQGLPGSGKSTFADDLIERHKGGGFRGGFIVPKVSADDFFISEHDGSYNFDPSKIGRAHERCMRDFVEMVRDPIDNRRPISFSDGKEFPAVQGTWVIVDNTNIHLWEMAPYVAVAKAYGFEVEIHTFHCTPEVAIKRNVHGVPAEVIQRMADEMEAPLPFWGQHFDHGSGYDQEV